MKVRVGFVSNSSSSSFCIMGTQLNDDEIIELYKKNYPDEEDSLWNYFPNCCAFNRWFGNCFRQTFVHA